MEEQLRTEIAELKELVLRLESKMDILLTAVNERDKLITESKKTIRNINSVFSGNSMSSLFSAFIPQSDIEFDNDSEPEVKAISEVVPFE